MWKIKEIKMQNQGIGRIVDEERAVSRERGGQIKKEMYILVYANDVVARDENVMRTIMSRIVGILQRLR